MMPKCQDCGAIYMGDPVNDGGIEKFLCGQCRPGSHYPAELKQA